MVDEAGVDLAAADGVDDGDVVGLDPRVEGGEPSRNAAVSSSPRSRTIAAMKSWNEAFEGATARRPSHDGSSTSSIVTGSSASSTVSVL